MKVILLAGGFGTRLSEYTKTIPKPMVKIAGKQWDKKEMPDEFTYVDWIVADCRAHRAVRGVHNYGREPRHQRRLG